MKHLFYLTFFTIAALFTTQSALSYQLAPTRFNSKKTTVYESITGLFGSQVHETITVTAENCQGTLNCQTPYKKFVAYDTNPLIVGVRWNDDPMALIPGSISIFVKYFSNASKLVKHGQSINHESNMLARSHFGDLQFLHSMANADKLPADTTKKLIVEWLLFCYKVAIEDIKETQSLKDTSLARYFPNAGIECASKTHDLNCVGDLFDYQQTYRNNPNRKLPIKDIALGVMLHTIQDSFSKSHVERNESNQIVQFYSYSNQCSNKHAHKDAMPDWNKKVPAFTYSKKILEIHNSPNNTNRLAEITTLIEEIYKLTSDAKVSGPGEAFSPKTGSCMQNQGSKAMQH